MVPGAGVEPTRPCGPGILRWSWAILSGYWLVRSGTFWPGVDTDYARRPNQPEPARGASGLPVACQYGRGVAPPQALHYDSRTSDAESSVFAAAALCLTVMATSKLSAQSSTPTIEGVSADSVRAILGPPTAQRRVEDVETLDYQTSFGNLVVYLVNGEASLYRPMRPLQAPSAKSKPKDVASAARKHLAAGDPWAALGLVDHCIRQLGGSRECSSELNRIATARWASIADRLSTATEEELAERASRLT